MERIHRLQRLHPNADATALRDAERFFVADDDAERQCKHLALTDGDAKPDAFADGNRHSDGLGDAFRIRHRHGIADRQRIPDRDGDPDRRSHPDRVAECRG